MESKAKSNFKKNNYVIFIKNMSGGVAGIGLVIYYLFLADKPIQSVLIFMKYLSLLVVFGLGLTVGAALKKQSLN